MLPIGTPRTTTWLLRSPSGLSRIGFMSTLAVRPAASACTACARPISRPSGVTAELSAMFCDLNGATEMPSFRNSRHSAATSRLLPTDDAVPRSEEHTSELQSQFHLVCRLLLEKKKKKKK